MFDFLLPKHVVFTIHTLVGYPYIDHFYDCFRESSYLNWRRWR